MFQLLTKYKCNTLVLSFELFRGFTKEVTEQNISEVKYYFSLNFKNNL